MSADLAKTKDRDDQRLVDPASSCSEQLPSVPQVRPSPPKHIKKGLTTDEAFKLAGGFGRFQLMSAVTNTLINSAVCLLFTSLAFLEV